RLELFRLERLDFAHPERLDLARPVLVARPERGCLIGKRFGLFGLYPECLGFALIGGGSTCFDRMAIPFHMPWRHPDSCITDKVPTGFNQNHVDQLKAHIVKLRDILEGVLVQSGLSRVWRNPMCDPMLRHSDNTVMSIHDFLCMPSLEKATVREEPHELGTSILGRVADRTTPPAPAGTAIPRASLEEIVITRPDLSGASSSGLAADDGVEHTDDGTLDDDGQRNGSEFAMEKEVKTHAELSGGARRTTRASSYASHGVSEDASSPAQEAVAAPDTQPLGTDAGADEIASDGNVDSYFDARVSNNAGDVLERDLLSFIPGPYYIPHPLVEGSGSESPPYNKDDWEEIHGVNHGLRQKELYKDPKVCRTALDRFPTPAETHRLRELSLVELSDWMSVLQCQLITHGSILNARYNHFLKNVERLTKRFLKSSKFNRAFAGVLNTAISVRVERGLRMDRTDEEFRGLSQKVAGFIPNAKEKFDRVIAAFPDITFPFLDKVSQHSQSSLQDIARLEPNRVTPSSQPSSAIASLRTNIHVRHSTSSSQTFGHTSTPEHLKKKKKFIEEGGPSAA
ncbi:hypothetical protein Tco_1073839, partial [Tanacetum coccineum]